MNERIQQLLAQSTYEIMGVKQVDQKQFAELIILECIDIISPYAVRMENFDGGHPIIEIRKRFGVES